MKGVVLSFLSISLVQAAEYSAVAVTETSGHEIQGKDFAKGKKERVEVSGPRGATSSFCGGTRKSCGC
jgi:hypothetical protein